MVKKKREEKSTASNKFVAAAFPYDVSVSPKVNIVRISAISFPILR